jgi:hypothetical protein
MYRNSLDGLAEQVRALEEQKHLLEADLTGLRHMRWPQRALRVGFLGVALLVAAGVGSILGYRHAVFDLAEASQADARTAARRIDLCNERLREVLRTKLDETEPREGRADAPACQGECKLAEGERQAADLHEIQSRLAALPPL